MKNLKEYIQESQNFLINKHSIKSDNIDIPNLTEYDANLIKPILHDLNKYAMNNGCTYIRFRNVYPDGFTIYLFTTKKFHVDFNGKWKDNDNSFKKCMERVYKYIQDRKQ